MLRITLIAVVLFLTCQAFGQGVNDVLTISDDLKQTDAKLSLGLGCSIIRQPYKGMENEIYVIPLIDFQKGCFSFHGKRAAYQFYKDCNWKFSFIGEIRPGVYEGSDDRYLKGMKDRDMTFDGGLAARTDINGIGFTASWLTDLFSKHQGQELRLTLDKRFSCNKLTLRPTAGFSYFDDNFSDYYYGVRQDEARPNRPAFDVDSSYSWFTGIWAEYEIDCDWSLYGGFTYNWYSSDITKSPVVSRDYMTNVMVGLKYSF